MIDEVKNIFIQYLKARDLRITPERLMILQEAYHSDHHFDADTLYVNMSRQFRVSRATVYNTLELLVECKLIRKHQFGSNLTLYEKSHGYNQHDHLICDKCNKILEFCDPRIQSIQELVASTYNFKISNHSLQFYGVCNNPDCDGKEK